MVLVDTSILIDFLRDRSGAQASKFNTILELNIPFGITSHIYQELLQGSATQKDFDTLKKYLDTFTIYAPRMRKNLMPRPPIFISLQERRHRGS